MSEPTQRQGVSEQASAAVGHGAQLTSVCLFTTGLIVQKLLVETYPAPDVVAVQFLLAIVPMVAGCLIFGRRLKFDRAFGRSLLAGVAWGMFAPGLVLLFSSAAAARTDGVTLSLMWGMAPILVPVFGLLVLGERFHWSLPVGGGIGFAGLVFLTLNREAIGQGDWIGNCLAAAAVLCASFSQIIGRRLNLGTTPWYWLATSQMVGAAIISSALALADGSIALSMAYDGSSWLAVGYLVFGMTIANFLAFNLALSRLPVAWTGLYLALNPAIGTVAAFILLGAVVRPLDVMGIAVIIVGVALPHMVRMTQGAHSRNARRRPS